MIQNTKQRIVLALTGALIILFVLYKISSCNKPKIIYNDTTSAFDTKINALDKRLKEYEANRAKTDSVILSLQDSMIVLKYAIKSKDQQIKNLKAKHEKERIDISKFSNADIQKFLSDRYGKR
jgi:3'-phosphoadenosine 5'-phosphosulfate sulfotransferase (PAPS reductase)/FAD synthetase